MKSFLKQLHISQNVNMVSGIKCNNCQRIQPTMPEYVFLNPNYRCVCLQEADPHDTDFLVISPTQEEIKELDAIVMKEYKKRGAKPKNRPLNDLKAEEKEYNKKYYEMKKTKNELSSVKCDLCQGNYSYYSKSHHEKSRKHRMVILEKELEELKIR